MYKKKMSEKIKSIEQINSEIVALNIVRKDLKAELKLKTTSDYFINNDSSDKLTNNMSETIRYFEQNHKDLLKAFIVSNNNEKLKVSDFHKLLTKKLA